VNSKGDSEAQTLIWTPGKQHFMSMSNKIKYKQHKQKN